jgi:hypothetical protein
MGLSSTCEYMSDGFHLKNISLYIFDLVVYIFVILSISVSVYRRICSFAGYSVVSEDETQAFKRCVDIVSVRLPTCT